MIKKVLTHAEQWRADLRAAGWREVRQHVWADPHGAVWRGPYGAWCALQDATRRAAQSSPKNHPAS